MEERKCSRTNKLLAERKQRIQLNKIEERKCSQTIKLLAEKIMNSIQHNGNKEMLKFLAERSNDLNSTECKKRTSRANKLVAERKQ